ncbi:hypothetical protein C9374_010066 [Naegleria lovaniensis]|uniref:Uncharacterized protein n=1 Tax=Naegleria lovaniensis TaxID=51637 RepID=A0AA88GCH2_NAELO|nr:uncharacterized protein C9374_010066 [Naegleria lovaniensis]KAG2375062.1 hypothetical protein C9374_010066 [Naegleria lovaniensis]
MSLPPVQANNRNNNSNNFSQPHQQYHDLSSQNPNPSESEESTPSNPRRRRRKSLTFPKKFAFLSTSDGLGRDVFKNFLNHSTSNHSNGSSHDNNNHSIFQPSSNREPNSSLSNTICANNNNNSRKETTNSNAITSNSMVEPLTLLGGPSAITAVVAHKKTIASPSTRLFSTLTKILPKSTTTLSETKTFNFIDESLGDRFVFYQIMAYLPMSACLGSALDLATLFEFENSNHYTCSNGISSLPQPLTRKDIYQRFENGSILLNCMLVHSRWYQLLNDEVFYKIIVNEQFPVYYEMYYKHAHGKTLHELEAFHLKEPSNTNHVTTNLTCDRTTNQISKNPSEPHECHEWKLILIDILSGMRWSPFISREKEYCYFHPNTFFARESRWKSSPSFSSHFSHHHSPSLTIVSSSPTNSPTLHSSNDTNMLFHQNSKCYHSMSGPSCSTPSVLNGNISPNLPSPSTLFTFPRRGGVVCENGKVIKAPVECIPRLKSTYQLFRMDKPILCDMNVEFQIMEEQHKDFKSKIHEDNFILLGIVDSDLLYSHGDVVGTPTQTSLVNEPMSETISAKFNYLGVYNIRSRYCGRSREVELNLGYASNGYLCYSTSNAGLFYDKWKPGDLISFEVTGINHYSRKRKRDRKKEYAQVLIRHNGKNVTLIEDFMLLNGPISRQDSITPFPKLYYFACNFYYGGNMIHSMAHPSGVKIHSIKYL